MSEQHKRVRWWTWVILGLILIALITAALKWWRPVYESLANPEQVEAWVEKLGALGPLAIILMEMLQALFIVIPGQAIEAAAGYLYGSFWGTVLAVIGITLGSLIVFKLSRRFGRPLVIKMIGRGSMDRLDNLVRRGGTPFFFLIWLLPFAPDDLAVLAAGLTPMPTHQFLVLMVIGRLPGVFVAVWVGANAARMSPWVWALLLIAMAVAALVLWRWGNQIQDAVLDLVERLSNRLARK